MGGSGSDMYIYHHSVPVFPCPLFLHLASAGTKLTDVTRKEPGHLMHPFAHAAELCQMHATMHTRRVCTSMS